MPPASSLPTRETLAAYVPVSVREAQRRAARQAALVALSDGPASSLPTLVSPVDPGDLIWARLGAQSPATWGVEQSGGGSVPYAWIGADCGAQIVNPNTGPVHVTWGSPASEGDPGFELNADTETWDCLTDGVYVVSIEPAWTLVMGGTIADNPPVVQTLVVFTSWHATIADPEAPWNQTYGGDQKVVLCGINATENNNTNYASGFQIPWTLPTFQFKAGDSFYFAVSVAEPQSSVVGVTDPAAKFTTGSNIVIARVG